MKLVHTAHDGPSAQLIRQVLEDHGIEAVVQGENLISISAKASGTYPTVWVSNDKDWMHACEVVAALAKHDSHAGLAPGAWVCKKCGEENEPAFSECWRCAKALEDGPRAPDPQTRKLKTALSAALFLALGCGFLSFFMSELLPADLNASQRWMRHLVSLSRLFAMFFCIIAFYFIVKLANVPKDKAPYNP